MGRPLYTNNAATYLAFGITNTATTMQVSANAGSLFPNPTGGDYFYVSLISLSGPIIEIVKCTARSGDIFTIERGQEGTSALYWNMGDNVQLRITAAGMNYIAGSTASTTLEQSFTATQGQTVFTLTNFDYAPGTNNLAVFVNGSKQVSGTNYTETNVNTVTFTTGLNVGDVVEFLSNLSVAAGTIYATDINYNEGATGAVTRTLESKLQETVSVKDFGAVGDGVTDDTDAIQLAITNGGSIYFPSGTYKITSTLVISSNTPLELFGEGRNESIISQDTVTEDCLKYAGVSYLSCNISNMQFIGGSASGIGLNFTNVYNCVWSNLYISGGTAGITIPTSCFSTQFNSVYASSANGHAFSIVSDVGTLFLNCYATSVPNTGGYAGYNLSGKATLISCNSLNSGGNCVNLVGTTGNFNFIGCNFEDFLSYGIYSTCGNLELTLDNCSFLAPSAITQPAGYECSLSIKYATSPIIIRSTNMLSKGATRNLATEVVVVDSDSGFQYLVQGPAANLDTITIAGVSHTAPYLTTSLAQYQNLALNINNLQATKVWLPSLATYANNAAALVGGLNAGSLYKTATGQVQVVY